jgi:hypothetical protein
MGLLLVAGLSLVVLLGAGCGGETVVGMGGVTGTVRDAETGDPLAGVRVHCDDTRSGEPADIITDSAGRFIISDLATGRARLTATATGYESLRDHTIDVVGGTVLEVDLDLPRRKGDRVTVRGTVSSDAGRPIARARVSAAAERTLTDGEGGYELALPRVTEPPVITFEARGHGVATRILEMDAIEGDTARLDVRLDGEGTRSLRGMVIDAHDGDPVEGVMVTCSGRSARTGPEGTFILDGLPPGWLELRCAARGYREETRRVGPAAELDGRIVVPLVSPSTGEISARAVDGTTGSPVDGVTVLTDPLGRRAVTDDRGRARIDHVPAGRYWLEYRAEGFERGRVGPFYVDPIEWPRVELALEPEGTRIVGRLLDPSGSPVPDHPISARPIDEPDEGIRLSARTDADGWFSFSAPELSDHPGRWRLTPEGGSAQAHVDVIEGSTSDAGPLTLLP